MVQLPAGTFRTRLDALLADGVADVDYWLKAEASWARQALGTAQEVREAVREGRHKSGS